MERIETMPVKPLITTITGLALLVPASYFSLLMAIRLLAGYSVDYYTIAPEFIRQAFQFSWHPSQLILYGPLFAILINVMTIWQFRVKATETGPVLKIYYRSYWLNMAIVLQAALLFLLIVVYLVVQHIRY